ncbi:MAG TPA: hypothetical protein VNL98_04995 [Gemmatimonadales bacterium]|nr:hypothetical protein [Gemmatimonadales bacterium]
MALTRAIWVAAYAVSMALVEAAVVVYLRALRPVEGPLAVLRTVLPDRIVAVEIAREAATLVMLLTVAVLSAPDRWRRFLYFSFAFGLWDIFYYVWLKVFIGWPESLLTWDVLFLIPMPWVGPVLAPVLVSVCLVGGSLWLLAKDVRALPWYTWALALIGAGLILATFTLDATRALETGEPAPFRWVMFGVGIGLAVVGLALGSRRGSTPRQPSQVS